MASACLHASALRVPLSSRRFSCSEVVPLSRQSRRQFHSTRAISTEGAGEPPIPGLLAKLGQSWNSAGIRTFMETIATQPELAMPHVAVPSIKWVSWQALKDAGFGAVVMDKDNTVTAPYAMEVHEQVREAVEECKECFQGKVAVMSNSAGLTQFDKTGAIAESLHEAIGLPVIRHSNKKPAGTAVCLERQLGCSADRIVFIGDRIFTDVVYGNRNKLITILTDPISPQADPFVVQQVRWLESSLLAYWKAQGVEAPLHPLAPGSPYKFIKDPGCW